MPDADDYKNARYACEIARNILRGHDIAQLLKDIEHADAVAPLLDPTLWVQKNVAMQEDRRVFAAALRFLAAWPKEDSNG